MFQLFSAITLQTLLFSFGVGTLVFQERPNGSVQLEWNREMGRDGMQEAMSTLERVSGLKITGDPEIEMDRGSSMLMVPVEMTEEQAHEVIRAFSLPSGPEATVRFR